MPTICSFFGIAIRTFFNDHAPQYLYARYGELPRRALVPVGDWGALHQAELLENWRLCREKAQPGKIEPLA